MGDSPCPPAAEGPAGLAGIFDSGVGGLSVLKAFRGLHPQQPLLYVADQVNVPYGPRSLDEVREFSEGITRYLLAQGGLQCCFRCRAAPSAGCFSRYALCRNGTGCKTGRRNDAFWSCGSVSDPGHLPGGIVCLGPREVRTRGQGHPGYLSGVGRSDRSRAAERQGNALHPGESPPAHVGGGHRYDRAGLHALPVRDPADRRDRGAGESGSSTRRRPSPAR
jgi:hypothetical protein